MTDAITYTIPAEHHETAALTPALIEPARAYAREAKAAATRRAYRVDWQAFDAWCSEHHLGMPPREARNPCGLSRCTR